MKKILFELIIPILRKEVIRRYYQIPRAEGTILAIAVHYCLDDETDAISIVKYLLENGFEKNEYLLEIMNENKDKTVIKLKTIQF